MLLTSNGCPQRMSREPFLFLFHQKNGKPAVWRRNRDRKKDVKEAVTSRIEEKKT